MDAQRALGIARGASNSRKLSSTASSLEAFAAPTVTRTSCPLAAATLRTCACESGAAQRSGALARHFPRAAGAQRARRASADSSPSARMRRLCASGAAAGAAASSPSTSCCTGALRSCWSTAAGADAAAAAGACQGAGLSAAAGVAGVASRQWPAAPSARAPQARRPSAAAWTRRSRSPARPAAPSARAAAHSLSDSCRRSAACSCGPPRTSAPCRSHFCTACRRRACWRSGASGSPPPGTSAPSPSAAWLRTAKRRKRRLHTALTAACDRSGGKRHVKSRYIEQALQPPTPSLARGPVQFAFCGPCARGAAAALFGNF
jgi:hypothetical protein